EEVRPNAGRKDDVGHFRDLSGLQIVVPIASDRVRQIRGPAVIKAEYVWLTAVKVNGTSTPRRCPGYAASFTCAGASNWVATSPWNVAGPTWSRRLSRSAQISPPRSVQRLQKLKSSLR